MSKIEGSCLCGNIKYKSESDPIYTIVCNCKNCQQISGSAFSVNIIVPSASIELLSGKPSIYMDKADSGRSVERQFCSNCGSHLFALAPASPELTVIKAGTLKDSSWLQPQVNIWCSSAQPWWLKLETGLPQFAKNIER